MSAATTRVPTPLGAEPEDLAVVEAKVKAAGTSFYQGMRVLPPDRRHAMYAIYAFCRIVDDIADDEGSLEDKLPKLQAWRERIAGLYRGEADDPVTRVLLLAVKFYQLRERDFLDVIDGMQMDAGAPMIAPDLDTLDLYCDRVAAAVGRLSVRAFGDSSGSADQVAYHLGRALQLTNILRDVAEDAERGRIYLPREWLEQDEVPLDPTTILAATGLARVCQRVAAQAHRHFGQAQVAMGKCDARAMKPARLMGATYAAILARLERRGWYRMHQRVSLPKWQKLLLALRYGLR